MNNQNLAISKLSLRTIQRIEKSESIPRGDTLIKLTKALEVTPDDLLEWTDIEDKGYLTLLNLSALTGLLFNPLLGIIIPLVMWILKKDKIKFIDNYGKKIISFQITWTIVIYSILILVTKGSYIKFDFNLFDIVLFFFSFRFDKELIYVAPLVILYLYNLILIFKNYIRIKKGKQSWYLPAIPFLK
ncbi:MAG: DNA-binding protein [Flavobacteriales bacterium]|nr:MAG: DNA-binding protein [Flavobacteriales bacterium]